MAWTAPILSSHLVLLLIVLEAGHAAENHSGQPTAEAPGDIMIGIIFPLHKKEKNGIIQPGPVKCMT